MYKLFSFGKNQAGVLITLVVLIMLGACYFFIYLPGNEKTVQERRFRCLRKVDESIRTKIETAETEITTLVNDYAKYQDSDEKKLAALRLYIGSYSKKNYVLLLPERASAYFDTITHHHHKLTYLADDTAGNKFFIDISSQITLLVKKPGKLQTTSAGSAGKGDYGVVIGIQFGFEQFIKPLLIPDVFDYYAVFIDTKKIYEGYPSGLTFTDPDSMLTVTGKIVTPGLHSLRIGETDYKVFSHPMYSYTQNKWIISGLLKNQQYQAEKNQLPLWLLLLMLTIAISMLLSLPWIKLFHMGNSDRLTTGDGIAALLMSMALMSMLFFAFFKYRVDFKGDRLKYRADTIVKNDTTKKVPRFAKDAYSRNVLASSVTNAFVAEINAANHLLDVFIKQHEQDVKQKNANITLSLLGKQTRPYDTLFNREVQQMAISQVFFLDPKGSENSNFSVDSSNNPLGHYDNRAYFKHAGEYRAGPEKFYLDQVFSYTTGDYKSIVSKKLPDKSVAAVSFYPKSIDKVVMPDGYQFAIISKAGWVLYHSIPSRNQVDRLQTEFTNNSDLVSSLQANADTSFETEYYGKTYNIKIKPIPNLPYYTVIFEDHEYNDIRDSEAYSFTLCMLIVMLVFLAITYCIIFFVSSRHSYFRKQHFDTSWVGPHATAHHEYNIATLANMFIILMLVIFFMFCSFLEYFYILLISVVLVSLVLNMIFARKFKDTDPYRYKFKRTAARWLAGLVIIIDITAAINLCLICFLVLALYQLIILGAQPVIVRLGQRLLQNLGEMKKKRALTWTFTNSYALMATTRLIISSGIPVAFFFIYSFNYEQNLDTRYRQMNFAAALVNKGLIDPGKSIAICQQKLDSIKRRQAFATGVYYDGLLISDIRIRDDNRLADSLKNARAHMKDEDETVADILKAFRLHTNAVEVANNYLNTPSAGDKAFFSKLNKKSDDESPVTTFYKIDGGRYLQISSLHQMNYQTPHWFFWFYLVLAVVVFYLVIHVIIKKVFALNAHTSKGWGRLDTDLLTDDEFSKKLLIVGPPGADTLKKLAYSIKKGKLKLENSEPLVLDDADASKNNVIVADMKRIPTENADSDFDWKRYKMEVLDNHRLVIINHFEYNIAEPGVNKIKLDLLEALVEQKTTKVIIISTVHPLIFLDSSAGPDVDGVSAGERGRWHMLLGDFRVLVDRLLSSGLRDNTPMPARAIIEETRYSRFLHRMQAAALRSLQKQIAATPGNEKNVARITDSLIFKLQLTAQYFYTDMWQSLTWEEKFLLYDLAEDGLVNSTDDVNLTLLICKGIVVNDDGVLVLFNRGFRNFILTSIEKFELAHIKQQLKDNGTWANLKTPFRLAILAILAFLFASQQEEYSRVITYITAFGAGIPAVMRIFSVFGGGAGQKTQA